MRLSMRRRALAQERRQAYLAEPPRQDQLIGLYGKKFVDKARNRSFSTEYALVVSLDDLCQNRPQAAL